MAKITFTAKEVENGGSLNVPVSVDGRAVGTTPITVEVPVGHHVVTFNDITTHKSAMLAHEFQVVEGQTGGAFDGLYHRFPPPSPKPAQPPKPPIAQPGKPPVAPPAKQFPCPAGDGVFTTRDALRMHIFDMQSKGDKRHVNVPR